MSCLAEHAPCLSPSAARKLYKLQEAVNARLQFQPKNCHWDCPIKKVGELFEALRTLRKRLADQEALPAYIVLSDKVLHLLSTSRPTTIEEFGNISGIGEYKKKKYGKEFVELIRKYS